LRPFQNFLELGGFAGSFVASGKGGEHLRHADQVDCSLDVVSENLKSRFGSGVLEALIPTRDNRDSLRIPANEED
jgi:hypothetical protein